MEKQIKDRFKKVEKRVKIIENFIEKEGLSKNGRLLHCEKCGNSWIYKGHKLMATCSSCGQKVKVI